MKSLNNQYYYCYNKSVHTYLHLKRGIPFICTALHEKTGKKFWLYEQDNRLTNALRDYQLNKNS
ncbi:hypothetical protein BEH_24220 [Priestia filamentosa]|uniref:Uncharacterized protein n=1 Tax=Priestia filamentosa TaxID=1402861 RepID=A0A2S1LZC0_9BACI|nr:hypothetical protein BEH_24220 [Priestia filamentosa]